MPQQNIYTYRKSWLKRLFLSSYISFWFSYCDLQKQTERRWGHRLCRPVWRWLWSSWRTGRTQRPCSPVSSVPSLLHHIQLRWRNPRSGGRTQSGPSSELPETHKSTGLSHRPQLGLVQTSVETKEAEITLPHLDGTLVLARTAHAHNKNEYTHKSTHTVSYLSWRHGTLLLHTSALT